MDIILYYICFTKVFFQSVACLFILTVFFDEYKLLIFIKSNFFSVYFFYILSNKSFPIPGSKRYFIFFFYPQSFKVLFIFKGMVDLEVMFLSDAR